MVTNTNSQQPDSQVRCFNFTSTFTRKQSMNLIKTLAMAATLTAATALSSAAFAEAAKAHDHHKAAAGATSATNAMPTVDADMTNAEVRKVDKDAKKITLKHEAIKSLDMPSMTMVFQVKDAALLDKAQAGDKVKVKIIQEGNAYVVTEMQTSK